jgi:hypothetical protein
MPIKLTDLKPGDRVMLNCPKARTQPRREAIFEGIFESVAAAAADSEIMAVGENTAAFLASGNGWARSLLQTEGHFRLAIGFRIEPDGSLREEDGRRIFIERRLSMGQG